VCLVLSYLIVNKGSKKSVINRIFWQYWAVFIGNYRLLQKKLSILGKSPISMGQIPCRKQAYDLWQ
jgi:hypothetical protein